VLRIQSEIFHILAYILLLTWTLFLVSIYSYMLLCFLAKQDSKKSKESLKSIKFQSDKKENAPAMYKVQCK
jgi:murein L,D-transpeptidase YafK